MLEKAYGEFILSKKEMNFCKKTIDQPPYSPDLAQCDFFCYQKSSYHSVEPVSTRLRS